MCGNEQFLKTVNKPQATGNAYTKSAATEGATALLACMCL